MRLSEIYTSVQGEGPRTGEPTIFVRFVGCNLRCPSWPCDTPFAIYPEQYLHDPSVKNYDAKELLEATPEWPRNVCLTGGEPMMQNHNALRSYVTALEMRGQRVEMFSNGTLPYPEDMEGSWRPATVLDWKLPSAGDNLARWDVTRRKNMQWIRQIDTIKFTLMDEDDLFYAQNAYSDLVHNEFSGPIEPSWYVGPVWDADPKLPAAIVEFIKEYRLPWNLNLQTHKFIYDPDERGI